MTALPPLHDARVIRVEISLGAMHDTVSAVREIMAQTPEASTLASGALVAIPDAPQTPSRDSLLRKMLQGRERGRVHRAPRCTALLARGFARLGAAKDETGIDWVWGFAP